MSLISSGEIVVLIGIDVPISISSEIVFQDTEQLVVIAFDVSKGNAHYQSFLSPNKHLHKPKKIRCVKVNIKFTKNDYLIFTNYGKS